VALGIRTYRYPARGSRFETKRLTVHQQARTALDCEFEVLRSVPGARVLQPCALLGDIENTVVHLTQSAQFAPLTDQQTEWLELRVEVTAVDRSQTVRRLAKTGRVTQRSVKITWRSHDLQREAARVQAQEVHADLGVVRVRSHVALTVFESWRSLPPAQRFGLAGPSAA